MKKTDVYWSEVNKTYYFPVVMDEAKVLRSLDRMLRTPKVIQRMPFRLKDSTRKSVPDFDVEIKTVEDLQEFRDGWASETLTILV